VDEHARREPLTNLSRNVRAPSRQSRVPPVRGRARGSARADREVLFREKLSARCPSADGIPLWTIGTSPGPPAAPSRPPAPLAWTRHGHRQFADSGPKALAARALLP